MVVITGENLSDGRWHGLIFFSRWSSKLIRALPGVVLLRRFLLCDKISASLPRVIAAAGRRRRSGTHGALQDGQKLLDAGFLFLRHLALPAEKAGVKFGGEQGVLETLHGPVEDGDN